jgi:hypothetical protein
MSETPRTDEATWLVLTESGKSERWAKVDLCAAIERDLNECLATLESVRDYLKSGNCFCYHSGDYLCQRCRMLADVETTLRNCKP